MKMRHFIYADAKEIASMYSQLFDDITEISTTVSKENKAEIEADIKIPNILQGFLPGNFSGDYERDCNHIISAQSYISIEKKIMALLEHVSSGEDDIIHNIGNDLLVVGRIKAMKYDQFLLKADELLQDVSLKFESFYETYCEESNFSSLWKDLVKKVMQSETYKMPFNMFDVVDHKSPKIKKIIILDADYPIIVSFSSNKLLISASDMESASKIALAENLSVLGLMRQVRKGFYTIKPVAMWEFLSPKKLAQDSWNRLERLVIIGKRVTNGIGNKW